MEDRKRNKGWIGVNTRQIWDEVLHKLWPHWFKVPVKSDR